MPNGDYILRREAVARLTGKACCVNSPGKVRAFATAINVIETMPSADVEPKQKWIPVTERLPEVGKEVLVYAVGRCDDFSSVIAITDRMIFRLFPSSEGVETWSSPWQYFMTNYEITHWMPLPEPPKEDDIE